MGEQQANKYTIQLEQRFDWLADNPNLRIQRDEIKTGYRSCNHGKHTIFYRVLDEGIEIIGIPHQSMNIGAWGAVER